MRRKVALASFLVICISLIFTGILNTSGSNIGNYEEVANTIMGYDYGDVDLAPIMLSDSTLRFKTIAVYNWWHKRHTDNMMINITKLYQDNKDNPEIVLDAINKGDFDKRLTLENGQYMIKLEDLNFSSSGSDYIVYEGKLIKLDSNSVPENFSNTKGNLSYKYNLVEVTQGIDEPTGYNYKEYHYNREVGYYGVGLRLLFDKNNKLVDYRLL